MLTIRLNCFFCDCFRGSGGEGLAGMKWRNPSPNNGQVELVRPMLDLPKQVFRDFAKQNQIGFREDCQQ
jgi:tRNA(Ile)-lysidine synthase TilS/MesJ